MEAGYLKYTVQYMKAVTFHIDEADYAELKLHARIANRSTSELLREGVRLVNDRASGSRRVSLADAPPPISVGRIRRTWSGREELLDTYFDRE